MQTVVVFEMPEEAEELKEYMDGPRWRCAMEELSNWLRSKTKHAEPSETTEALETARTKLFDIVIEHGLTL